MRQSKTHIGLTGGIATGKSAATAILRDLGQEVIDADLVSRQVVEPGSKGLEAIAQTFGPRYIDNQGGLDREGLGQLVFSDDQARQALDSLLHPLIIEEVLTQAQASKSGLVFFDIPLLFEAKSDHEKAGLDFDEIWLVYAPKHIQEARLQARDQISPAYAQKKISSQMDIEEKRQRADSVLDNQGDLQDLRAQLESALEGLGGRGL